MGVGGVGVEPGAALGLEKCGPCGRGATHVVGRGGTHIVGRAMQMQIFGLLWLAWGGVGEHGGCGMGRVSHRQEPSVA